MPLLLVLLLAVACLPIPWPEPDFGPDVPAADRAAVAGAVAGGLLLGPLLAAGLLVGWVVEVLRRDPGRRPDVARAYGRAPRRLGYLTLAAAAAGAWWGGWGWAVWNGWDALRVEQPGAARGVLAPGAELLVPLPYLLALGFGWVLHFPAERALYAAAGGKPGGFWTLPGFVLFHARQFALVVLFPVVVLVGNHGVVRAYPAVASSPWFQAASLGGMVALFVVLPRFVKPLLGLVPLPPGPVRTRLEQAAARLGFRYTDLLLWPTRGAVANALVLGVVARARYVVFTDRLLDGLEPDELDAVLGHEIGHVRHRHIPYYAGFLVASSAVVTAAVALVSEAATAAGWTTADEWAGWLTVPPVLAMGAYLFAVFGLLSRRCEQQADVFGCRAGSCTNPRCGGHDETTVLAANGAGLCPTGVRALVHALDRVAALNGMDGRGFTARQPAARVWAFLRAWQHGPIPDRIEFLYRLAEDPALADRTDARVFRFRARLMAGLLVLLAVLGSAVGWERLWAML